MTCLGRVLRSNLSTVTFPAQRLFPGDPFLWPRRLESFLRRCAVWDRPGVLEIAPPWADRRFARRRESGPSLLADGHSRELRILGGDGRLRDCARQRRNAAASLGWDWRPRRRPALRLL